MCLSMYNSMSMDKNLESSILGYKGVTWNGGGEGKSSGEEEPGKKGEKNAINQICI